MQVFKNNVSLEATPASDTHIVNKGYVDGTVESLYIENGLKSNYKKIIDGVYIQYSGKHRVLNVDTSYSNLKNILLDNNDRPIITTSTSIIRTANSGGYVTIAYLQVNKDGTLDVKKYDAYNGTTGASAFADTDVVYGSISYITN